MVIGYKYVNYMNGVYEVLCKLEERLENVTISGENSRYKSDKTDFMMQFLETNFTRESDISEDQVSARSGPRYRENLATSCPRLAEFGKHLMMMKCKFEAIVEYTGTGDKIPGTFNFLIDYSSYFILLS